MFSNRLDWCLEPNELALALAEKRRLGIPVLDLTLSNPTQAGLEYPREVVDVLSNAAALRYEPAPWGLEVARQAVAAEHQVDAGRVMITASTSESYSYLFKLLCSPGDNVLVPKPSYPLFEFLAKLESVELRQYPLRYCGVWRIDFEALQSLVDARSRAVLLVNPNNPTGSFLKREELPYLLDFCARHDLAIVSDEVFSSYQLLPGNGERVVTLAHHAEGLTFCLNGLSKLGGLPQMKVGWMILGGPEKQCRRAAELLELIADTFLSVSTPVQHALPQLLPLSRSIRKQIHARIEENLRYLRTRSKPLEVEGGWYAILGVPEDEQALALDLLRYHNVLVQPGFFYDFEEGNHLVLSLLAKPWEFRAGLEALLGRI
ncbi:MAG: pyridoxal phosphate-dependent aminotransferase [Bryobacteraceae bacterium]|nr:pyridoxal phosphate-dependent aminotransferase [Bryobacteraceae bacterium]MDW8379856.1 pyridoxal phosphate-dependent aminotransferase [Bryobacterales bacterium]